MTEWIKCSESLPQEQGKLIVIINNEMLFGVSIDENTWSYYNFPPETIVFSIEYQYTKNKNNNILISRKPIGGKWHKPVFYADVTHLMKMPKLPQEENATH